VIWMNGPMASNTSSNQILKQQQTLFCLLWQMEGCQEETTSGNTGLHPGPPFQKHYTEKKIYKQEAFKTLMTTFPYWELPCNTVCIKNRLIYFFLGVTCTWQFFTLFMTIIQLLQNDIRKISDNKGLTPLCI
jgi:hypothetical protein